MICGGAAISRTSEMDCLRWVVLISGVLARATSLGIRRDIQRKPTAIIFDWEEEHVRVLVKPG